MHDADGFIVQLNVGMARASRCGTVGTGGVEASEQLYDNSGHYVMSF